MRMTRWAVHIIIAVVCCCGAVSAQQRTPSSVGVRLSSMEKELSVLEDDFKGMEGRYLSPFVASRDYTESPSKKMEKADFYFRQKDYISSGGIYYSVFSVRKERDFIWEESLFKLAESLFLNKNYISASRYYEVLLAEKPYSRFQVEALKRLIASSYYLGEYSKAKTYYAEFLNIGYDMARDQELVYFLAKALFFDKQYDEAQEIFKTVRNESTFYPQSLYFLGVITLQRGEMDTALSFFKQLTDLPGEKGYSRYEAVRDLAILAQGRILFEKGDFPGATDAYLKLDRGSDLFAEAYFELCWAYIRREQYEKALDALRLIKYIAPGSLVVPQAALLEGNLLIKLRKYAEAMLLFNNVVKEYADIRNELNTLKKSGRSFFDQSLGADEGKFSLYSPLVRSLLKNNKKFSHAIRLHDDLKSIEMELEQVSKMESKLASIVESKNAASIFPPLKEGTEQAISSQNRLSFLRNEILKVRAEIALSLLSEQDRKRYQALEQEKETMQKKIADLMPKSTKDIEEKVARNAKQLIAFGEELHRSSIRMKALYDQLDAVGEYHLRQAGQPENADPRITEKIEQEKKRTREMMEQITSFKKETEDDKNRMLLGGNMLAQMVFVRDAYDKIIAEQEKLILLVPVAAGAEHQKAKEISTRIDDLSKKITLFNEKLNEVIGGIIQNIKDSFESEKIKIEEYKSQLLSLRRETAEIASLAMHTNIAKVNQVFDDLVLKADQGIIDVAWEKKDEATQNLKRLIIRRAQEMRELNLNLENLE